MFPLKLEKEFEYFLINPKYMDHIEKGAKFSFCKSKSIESNKELRKKIYDLLLEYLISGKIMIKAYKNKIVIEKI